MTWKTIAMQTITLLKCRLLPHGMCKTYVKTRWLVEYSSEYFKSNKKYADLFALSTSKSGVRDSKKNEKLIEMKEILDNIDNCKRRDDVTKYDTACVDLLNHDFHINYSFPLLQALHSLAGKNAFYTSFYKSIVRMWGQEASQCSVLQLVAMLYFLGQTEKNPADLLVAIQKRLEQLCNEPSFEEWVLVCHNFFVMKVQLPPVIMQKVLYTTINCLPNINTYQLITVLKALRHSRFPIHNLLPPLSEYVLQSYHKYSLVECAHFLATYANTGSYDLRVFRTIEEHVFEKLLPKLLPTITNSKSYTLHPSIGLRSKDIARLLWSMAHVGHNLASRNFESILFILQRKVIAGDFDNDPQHIVDCIQSLILYGHFQEDLLMHVLHERFVEKCINTMKAKPCHQLFFVSLSTLIELPECTAWQLSKRLLSRLGNYLKRPPSKELASRRGLQKMLTIVKNYYDTQEDSVKCMSLLPHIPIAGIVLKLDKQAEGSIRLCFFEREAVLASLFDSTFDLSGFASFEVLDSNVMIGNRPHGLLATKIRQMRKLGCKVITLSTDSVFRLEQMKRKDLKEEIDKLIFCE